MSDDILVEKRRHTTIFTINRPARLNSLGGTVIPDLAAGVKEFQADPDQCVAIVTGAGDEAFSAGADLKEAAEQVSVGGAPPLALEPDIAGLAACEKVTIAAINGLAVGGGLAISISCDIRIASERAWFGLFEVKRGILAGLALSVLPRLMPFGAVADLILSGEKLDAREALRLGLVQKVVAHDTLMEAALEKAETIAKNSPAAVWGSKQILAFWRHTMIAEQHRYYEAVARQVFAAGDVLEGTRAFTEKRPPEFVQKWSPGPEPGRRLSFARHQTPIVVKLRPATGATVAGSA